MIAPLFAVAVALAAPIPPGAIARADSAVSAEVAHGFSGVVLIADGDSVLMNKAYGRAATEAAGRDLAFWLASDSKQVTATAVMRLQQTGKLSVRDTIGRFFPSAPPDKRGITLHQLLTHTSGLPTEYKADGIVDRDRAVAAILGLKLQSQPGTRFSYSNDGYNLLAAIVDQVSGVGFDAFIVDSLFTRAGLRASGVWGHERPDARIASPADPRRTQDRPATIFHDGHSVANWGYRGAGGVFATAPDVRRWIQALRTGAILDEASLRELLGHQFVVRSDSTGESYTGYGWGVRVEHGRDVSYSHAGNEDWLGHNAILRFTPEGAILVVLCNSGDVDGDGWSVRVSKDVRHVIPALH